MDKHTHPQLKLSVGKEGTEEYMTGEKLTNTTAFRSPATNICNVPGLLTLPVHKFLFSPQAEKAPTS